MPRMITIPRIPFSSRVFVLSEVKSKDRFPEFLSERMRGRKATAFPGAGNAGVNLMNHHRIVVLAAAGAA